MALSEEEQKLLDQLERDLYSSDVDYVAADASELTFDLRRGLLGILIALAGLGGIITGVALAEPLIGIAGFAVMFIGVLFATSAVGKGKGKKGRSGNGTAPSSPSKSSGFSKWREEASRRWDPTDD